MWSEFSRQMLQENTDMLIHQLLYRMKNYENDQHFDAEAYDVINQNFEVHSSTRDFSNFQDAISSCTSNKTTQVAIFAVISAVEQGYVAHVENIVKDLEGNNSENLPEELTNVGFYNNGDSVEASIPTTELKMVSATTPPPASVLSENVFFRTARYVITPIQDGVAILMQNVREGQREFTRVVCRFNGDFALPSPSEDKPNTQTEMKVEVYSKPIITTTAGEYLPEKYPWHYVTWDVGITTAALAFMHQRGTLNLLIPLSIQTLKTGSGLFASYAQLGWKQKVVVAVGASTAISYGPVKTVQFVGTAAAGVYDAVTNPSKILMPLAFVGVAGIVAFIVVNGNKRQKT